MVNRVQRSKRRKQQAINIAGLYGAILLLTIMFRERALLLGLVHIALAGWFGYLYISKQVLGLLLYGLASAITLIGLMIGGAYFGALWFLAVLLTGLGLLNTVNQSHNKAII